MKPLQPWHWFAFGSAFFAGLTAILGKLGVAGLNSNVATFVRTVVILALTAAIVSVRAEWEWPQERAFRPIMFLVLSGVATGLSWLCYYRALQLAPASAVAPVDKLSVAFAMVLGAFVLGESISLQMALGGGLMVAGALLVATG